MDLPFVCDGREKYIKWARNVIAIENRDIQKIPLILSLVIKNPSKYDFQSRVGESVWGASDIKFNEFFRGFLMGGKNLIKFFIVNLKL